MGRNHARVLQSLPDVELVAAVDPRDPRSNPRCASRCSDTVRELIDRGIDLCVVATPTSTHEAIGLELAEAGIAALIEKPLAHDSKAAQTIVEAFARNGVIGCVGHIERYNPALQDMRRRLALGELGTVYQVVTRRQGPFPARIADAGVVLDLATHDIDLTAWVTQSAYRSVSARVAHQSGRAHEDLVSAVAELDERDRRHPPRELALAAQGTRHHGDGRARVLRRRHAHRRPDLLRERHRRSRSGTRWRRSAA